MSFKFKFENPVDIENKIIVSNEQQKHDLEKDIQYRMIPNTPAFFDLRSIDSIKSALWDLSSEEVDMRVAAWKGNHQSDYPRWAGLAVIVQLRDGSSLCWGDRSRISDFRKLLVFDLDDRIHVVWSGP